MRRQKKRRKRDRVTRFKAGAIGIVVIILFSLGAYTKFANPFANPFEIHAVFANANGLVINAPVRIAGVNVGKVTGIDAKIGSDGHGQSAAEVTMDIDSNGLPIHGDATFSIRPRIFLEGNFFVDVHPGTPEAPTIGSGHVFPITQGTEPVQIDQLLSALPQDTRSNLQILLEQYGKAVNESGASYNRSIQYWLPAYKYSAIVGHDFLGIQPHDLSGWIDKMGAFSAALDSHPQNLQNLITDFNTTAAAFARQNAALQATLAELPRTLSVAIPTFNALNAAFPPLREFARTLLPGVKSSGPAIDASLPFLDQLRQLVQPSELGGLARDLSVTVPALAKLTNATIPLMRDGVRPLSSCVVNIIYPWSQLTINDGVFSGQPGYPLRKVFQEGVDYLPGLAGESRDFDANGPYIRILGNGGTLTYSLQPGLFGTSLAPIVAEQPTLPPGGKVPPLQSTVPCESQAPITTVNTPVGPPIQSMATDMKTPGATARFQSAAKVELAQLLHQASQEGVKVSPLIGGTPTSATKPSGSSHQ